MRAHEIGAKISSVHTGADPRNHELKYKKALRASFVDEISLIPYLHLIFHPIRGFTRKPNGSEPHGSVLFIRCSAVNS